MLEHKAIVILWWIVPFRWIFWFSSIFASVIGAFEVSENLLKLDLDVSRFQQIPIALFTSGIGVIFLTNEKILNPQKNLKNIDSLFNRIEQLEKMNQGSKRDFDAIKQENDRLSKYGVELDPWRGIKLGEIAYFAGNKEDAKSYFQNALDDFISVDDKLGQAKALNNLGNVEENLNEAYRLHHQSLLIRKNYNFLEGVSCSLNNLGTNAKNRGDIDEAERLFQEALKVGLESGEKSTTDAPLANLGIIYFDKGNYDEAKKMALESLEISRINGWKVGEQTYSGWNSGSGVVLRLLGKIEEKRGEYELAKRFYTESIEKSRGKNRRLEAKNLLLLGFFYESTLGDNVEAERIFQNSLDIAKSMNCNEVIASCQSVIAGFESRRGNLDKAEQLYKKSLEIYKNINDLNKEMDTLTKLGRLYHKKGRFDEAEKMYLIVLDYYEKSNDQKLDEKVVKVMEKIGDVSFDSDNFEKARRYYKKGLARARDNNMKKEVAWILDRLARLEEKCDNFSISEELWRESEKIFREIGDKNQLVTVLFRIGFAIQAKDFRKSGKKELPWNPKVKPLFQECLTICQENDSVNNLKKRTIILPFLAEIAEERNDLEEAKRLYAENLDLCEKLGDKNEKMETLEKLGKVLCKKGDFHNGNKLIKDSNNMRIELGLPLLEEE